MGKILLSLSLQKGKVLFARVVGLLISADLITENTNENAANLGIAPFLECSYCIKSWHEMIKSCWHSARNS